MTTTSESTFTLSDGLEVYTKTWAPAGPPKAHAVFIHGFSDHSNAYDHIGTHLADHSILFYSFDQRGFGRTSLQKATWGITGPAEKVLADIDEVLESRLNAFPDIPCFLVGHSMGGGIALTYGYSGAHRSKLRGIVVWSPWIQLAGGAQPNPIVVLLGRLVAKLLPNRQLVPALNAQAMSRDPVAVEAYVADTLCHGTGTLQGIAGSIARGAMLTKKDIGGKFDGKLSVLVAHGTKDQVTDFGASRRFYEGLNVEDKAFLEYDGWFHQLHAEPEEDKKKFASDVCEWISARAEKPSGDAAASKL